MPTIVFVANRVGLEKSIEAPEGGALVDLCDDIFAPVPFSCRNATCATCQIEIVEGGEWLEPPSREERALLHVLQGPSANRLACQARVRAGHGLVRLRPIGA